MLCAWQRNRRSGTAVAMRHRLSRIPIYWHNGLRNGDKHLAYAPVEYGIFTFTLWTGDDDDDDIQPTYLYKDHFSQRSRRSVPSCSQCAPSRSCWRLVRSTAPSSAACLQTKSPSCIRRQSNTVRQNWVTNLNEQNLTNLTLAVVIIGEHNPSRVA